MTWNPFSLLVPPCPAKNITKFAAEPGLSLQNRADPSKTKKKQAGPSKTEKNRAGPSNTKKNKLALPKQKKTELAHPKTIFRYQSVTNPLPPVTNPLDIFRYQW